MKLIIRIRFTLESSTEQKEGILHEAHRAQ
jgi:hypothetical protein